MTDLTHTTVAAARRHDTFGSLARRVARMIAIWQRRVRERHQLGTMTDRELRDVGITRFDADELARKPFWRT